eukprot:TRINITY_DN82762_c0_g1_i1.p1 TRINITY_DN82762_c0_g1~~TRINITY_DN82762_c0_g1_i1.p1  ORF type:complete len:237 (-),score=20.09 TRINITY_DN82762_c0_g1_i1:131-841(-)
MTRTRVTVIKHQLPQLPPAAADVAAGHEALQAVPKWTIPQGVLQPGKPCRASLQLMSKQGKLLSVAATLTVSDPTGTQMQAESWSPSAKNLHVVTFRPHMPGPYHMHASFCHRHLTEVAMVWPARDESCSICLDEFAQSQPVLRLHCGHIMHLQCGLMHAAHSGKRSTDGTFPCPLCRAPTPLASMQMYVVTPECVRQMKLPYEVLVSATHLFGYVEALIPTLEEFVLSYWVVSRY